MAINQSSVRVNLKVNLSNTLNIGVPRTNIVNNTVTTLKSQFLAVDTLGDLNDVLISAPQDGDILVYDNVLNKYVIKQLESVDGGSF